MKVTNGFLSSVWLILHWYLCSTKAIQQNCTILAGIKKDTQHRQNSKLIFNNFELKFRYCQIPNKLTNKISLNPHHTLVIQTTSSLQNCVDQDFMVMSTLVITCFRWNLLYSKVFAINYQVNNK